DTRQVLTSTGLTGGGNLTADRTLAVVDDTTTQRVRTSRAGALAGVRRELNFVAGVGQIIDVVDNAAANRVDITVSLGGTGPANPTTFSVDGAVVGVRPELNLITGAGISLTGVDNTGTNRVDITVTSTVVGGVSSFHTRTGAVVPVAGDYTAAQVTNAV